VRTRTGVLVRESEARAAGKRIAARLPGKIGGGKMAQGQERGGECKGILNYEKEKEPKKGEADNFLS